MAAGHRPLSFRRSGGRGGLCQARGAGAAQPGLGRRVAGGAAGSRPLRAGHDAGAGAADRAAGHARAAAAALPALSAASSPDPEKALAGDDDIALREQPSASPFDDIDPAGGWQVGAAHALGVHAQQEVDPEAVGPVRRGAETRPEHLVQEKG